MNNKLVIVPLLFCALISACSRHPQETEPNDSFDTAVKIEQNSVVTGTISSDSDQDYYTFDCTQEGRISIDLTSLKGINHQITLYRKLDGNQAILKRIDDSRKSSPEYMPVFGVMPGTYFVKISHGERDTAKGSEEIRYELTLAPFSAPEGTSVEYEPNDLPRIATPLDSGVPLAGYYSPSFNKLNDKGDEKYREYDYFSFEVSPSQAGGFIADFTVSGVPGVDSIITLFGPNGFPLNESDSGEISAGESIVGQGLNRSGTYTLRLAVKNYASNNQTPYILNFTAAKADSSIEMERNDEITSANIMRAQTVRGRIFPEGDIDYYTYLAGDDPHFVSVKLVPAEGVNCRVHMYDAAGEKLFEVDNEGPGMAEVFPGIFTTGRMFIQVEAFAGELGADKYYTLSVERTAYQDDVEFEPNDFKEGATPIENSIMYGYTSYPGDTDFFLVSTEDREQISFRVSGIKGASATVSVTDNLGYVINTYPMEGEDIVEFTELVNRRAYLKIDTQLPNYNQPYIIEIFTEGR